MPSGRTCSQVEAQTQAESSLQTLLLQMQRLALKNHLSLKYTHSFDQYL